MPRPCDAFASEGQIQPLALGVTAIEQRDSARPVGTRRAPWPVCPWSHSHAVHGRMQRPSVSVETFRPP